MLGGVSIAMAHDVAQMTLIPRPRAAQGDDGTNDMNASDVIRRNELQVWFVASHAIDTPLVHAE